MKTIISFLVLACLIQPTKAQIPIDSFYVPRATWTVAYPWEADDDCPGFSIMGNEKILYRIVSDTIISGINYHILAVADGGGYVEPITGYGGCSFSVNFSYGIVPLDSLAYQIFARIRVDSNRVYFIQDSTFKTFVGPVPLYFTLGQEYLLYDFNLTVDSVTDSSLANLYVNSIDSVTLSNGINIAKYNDTLNAYWNTSDPHYPETTWGPYCWIWGIGSSFGLLPDLYGTLTAYGPGAHYSNGDQIALCYENPTFSYKFLSPVVVLDGNLLENCFDDSTLNTPNYKTTNIHEVDLFPNPAETQITVTADYTITKIAITNLLGQTVYRNQCNSTHIKVDIAGLQSGVYFAKVNGTEVRKFVKE